MRASILGHARGKVRRDRAQWIVDLAELQHLAIGRTWVTLDRATGQGEWTRIWMRSRRWSGAIESPRWFAFDLQSRLRELCGFELRIETPDKACGQPMRIHVATAQLRAVVEDELDEAFEILAGASREPGFSPSNLTQFYGTDSLRLSRLSRLFRRSQRKIRALLVAAKIEIAPPGRPPLERVRPKHLVDRARAAARGGASLRELARILECSTVGAAGFRARVERATG